MCRGASTARFPRCLACGRIRWPLDSRSAHCPSTPKVPSDQGRRGVRGAQPQGAWEGPRTAEMAAEAKPDAGLRAPHGACDGVRRLAQPSIVRVEIPERDRRPRPVP
jgi:hypothetical protein